MLTMAWIHITCMWTTKGDSLISGPLCMDQLSIIAKHASSVCQKTTIVAVVSLCPSFSSIVSTAGFYLLDPLSRNDVGVVSLLRAGWPLQTDREDRDTERISVHYLPVHGCCPAVASSRPATTMIKLYHPSSTPHQSQRSRPSTQPLWTGKSESLKAHRIKKCVPGCVVGVHFGDSLLRNSKELWIWP